jgi:hypothetical protein
VSVERSAGGFWPRGVAINALTSRRSARSSASARVRCHRGNRHRLEPQCVQQSAGRASSDLRRPRGLRLQLRLQRPLDPVEGAADDGGSPLMPSERKSAVVSSTGAASFVGPRKACAPSRPARARASGEGEQAPRLPLARSRTPSGSGCARRTRNGGWRATVVPRRPSVATRPRALRARYAPATVVGLTPRSSARLERSEDARRAQPRPQRLLRARPRSNRQFAPSDMLYQMKDDLCTITIAGRRAVPMSRRSRPDW